MKRMLPVIGLLLIAIACEVGDAPDGARDAADVRGAGSPDTEPAVRAERRPPVEPVSVEVFLREPAPDVGPGRMMVHLLVRGDASQEQVRSALVQTLEAEAERDTTLVAIRGVAYKTRPTTPEEAQLVPVAWAEWLPPDGWYDATPESRDDFHRVYTYTGGPPEW